MGTPRYYLFDDNTLLRVYYRSLSKTIFLLNGEKKIMIFLL